ncbi:unnamed protein product [Brassicogethes aeneus]|uniref:Uncharacterized protein n=1 Tax=Brassicogethes aeneus TaxID=1431903 RepID=A0A9P0FK60_BRAAE|nr:unnamed protein product [Brassicogethes aeneus]
MEYRIVLPESKNDICRFCMSISENMSHTLYKEQEHTKLFEMLSILQLDIICDDVMPNNVCLSCEQKIQEIHSFRYMIIENEKILKCVYQEGKDEEYVVENKDNITLESETKLESDSEFENTRDDEYLEEIDEEQVKVKKKRRKLQPGEKPVNRSKLMQCETCNKTFRRDYLRKHKCKGVGVKPILNEEIIDDKKEHVCNVCAEVYDSELRCLLHYIQHFLFEGSEKIDPVVYCNFCGFVLQTFEEYLSHISDKHVDFSSMPWPCKVCEISFSSEFELINHMHNSEFCAKTLKPVDIYGECLICKKEYEGSLLNHLKKHLLKRHNCAKCGDKFIMLMAYNNHLLLHPEFKYKCNYCRRMFVLKSNMEKHIKEMHQDEKFICEICSKLFNRKNNLESHIKQKHDESCKKIICPLCGYSTVSKHDLKRHERFHTNEKPYVCNFEGCTKAYKTSSALSHHKKTHLNIRNYRCDICEKCFYTSNHLKDHMYIHTGERNFTCQICDRSFKRKDQLTAHYKIHGKKGIEHEIKVDTQEIFKIENINNL